MNMYVMSGIHPTDKIKTGGGRFIAKLATFEYSSFLIMISVILRLYFISSWLWYKHSIFSAYGGW